MGTLIYNANLLIGKNDFIVNFWIGNVATENEQVIEHEHQGHGQTAIRADHEPRLAAA